MNEFDFDTIEKLKPRSESVINSLNGNQSTTNSTATTSPYEKALNNISKLNQQLSTKRVMDEYDENKRAKSRNILAAISEGIGSIGNIINAFSGAPAFEQPNYAKNTNDLNDKKRKELKDMYDKEEAKNIREGDTLLDFARIAESKEMAKEELSRRNEQRKEALELERIRREEDMAYRRAELGIKASQVKHKESMDRESVRMAKEEMNRRYPKDRTTDNSSKGSTTQKGSTYRIPDGKNGSFEVTKEDYNTYKEVLKNAIITDSESDNTSNALKRAMKYVEDEDIPQLALRSPKALKLLERISVNRYIDDEANIEEQKVLPQRENAIGRRSAGGALRLSNDNKEEKNTRKTTFIEY